MIEVLHRPARRRAGDGPARAAPEELHGPGRASRTRPRSASSTTPATTRRRWTCCSTHFDADAEQGRGARAASCAASASRPTPRSAAWRRRASPGRRASACRPACGSRRWCACTSPARSPSTPAPRRTARGWRRRWRRSSPTGSGTDPQNVEVIHGDTGTGPQGLGTYGSRSTAVGGESVARATAKIVDKARQIVAHQLEAARRGHRAHAPGSSRSRARRTRA